MERFYAACEASSLIYFVSESERIIAKVHTKSSVSRTLIRKLAYLGSRCSRLAMG